MQAPASSGGDSFSMVWARNMARVVGLASVSSWRREDWNDLDLDMDIWWMCGELRMGVSLVVSWEAMSVESSPPWRMITSWMGGDDVVMMFVR